MNEDHAVDLIEIGSNLGMYTIINMMLEGIQFTPDLLQSISDLCAKEIERVSGMPAEDFALKVRPVIEKVIKVGKENK